MKENRKVGIIYGLLLLSAIVFGIFSSVPALEKPNYLSVLPRKKPQVFFAVVCQFAMATVYVAKAAVLHPMIKRYNKTLATGILLLRGIAATVLYLGSIALLMLLFVSEQALEPNVRFVGELIRRGRDWTNHVAMILPWSMSAVLLYSYFLKAKRIAGGLAVWGIFGNVLTFVSTWLLTFGAINIVSPTYFILNMPTAFFELTLAIVLISKGFREKNPEDNLI